MSFGFGGGFGSSQPASPFGTPAPAFGQTPAFGQQNSSPFGASSSSLFGASSSGFGGGQSSVFGGGGMSSGFGSSTFGAKPSGGGFGGFGGSSPFGSSQPAFGSSTPAFGSPQSTPAFGSQPFGSTPSNPFGGGGGFGQSQSAFGSQGFGASSSAFGGGGSPGFGGGFGQQQQTAGTRNVNYQKVQDQEGAGSAKSTVYLCTISAMPPFQPPNEKCCNELRWEDYQAGVKGNTGGPGGGFGQSSVQTSNPFGVQASTPAFGQASTPAFGQSSPGFGFGNSQPAFGSNTGGIFGTPSSSPAFGASSSSFGNTFGQSSAAFGTSNPFGSFPQSQPAFGASSGFGSSFGSSPGFGTPQSSTGFGGNLFGSSTPQPFGQQSTPGFGTPAASSGGFSFGTAGMSQPFGSSSPSLFGPSSGGFGFGQNSSPALGSNLFGGSSSGFKSPGLFGSTPGSTPSLFGNNSGSNLFGPSPATGGLFGGGGGMFGGSSSSLFGTPGTQQTGQLQLGNIQAPGMATSPYGTLPPQPDVAHVSDVPELKVGLSTRTPALFSQRAVSLLSARPLGQRSTLPPTRLMTPRQRPRRALESSVDTVKEPERDSESGLAHSSGSNIFMPPRKNPLQFFVRDALPSTESSLSQSLSPSAPPSDDTNPQQDAPKTPKESPKVVVSVQQAAEETPKPSAPKSDQKTPPATNGEHPQPEAKANGSAKSRKWPVSPELTDDEVTKLLPFTNQEHLSIEPRLTQLAAMAREEPDSLKSVSNFKIVHAAYGSIKWLEPVDVTGLDLDGKVRITKGNIEVYLDDRKKPEIGTGLNKPAEVTLLGIFRLDKKTGRPLKDETSVAQFVKKLKSVSAKQNAKFVDYNAEKGIWRFQVDHFSKYGLPDSDSDDDMDIKPLPALPEGRPLVAPGSPGSEIAETIHTPGFPDNEDDDERMEEGTEANDSAEEDEPGLKLPVARADQSAFRFPLPTASLLGVEPSELAWMKEGLYPSVRTGFAPLDTPAPQSNAKRRSAESGLLSPPDRLRPRLDEARPSSARIQEPQKPRANNWIKEEASLGPPVSAPQWSQPRPQDGESSGPECLVLRTPHPASQSHRINVDGGVFLGPSFRVCLSLQNSIFAPGLSGGSRAGGPLASEISVQSLLESRDMSHNPQGASPEVQEHWISLLEGYAQYTCAKDDSVSVGGLNQWRLKCSAKDELQQICSRFIDINSTLLSKVPKSSLQGVCISHQTSVWRLVAALFSEVPTPPEAMVEGVSDEDDEEAYGQLIKAKWHAKISDWLKAETAEGLEAMPRESSTFRKIAGYLAAYKLGQAAAVATSSGNPRLAMLIVQAAAGSMARKDLSRQLEVWERKGLRKHMEPELVNIYELLAGNPQPVIHWLKLDWVQAFALYFWYTSTADADLSETFESYKQALQEPDPSQRAPEPAPKYVQKFGRMSEKQIVDVAFSLIQLGTGGFNLHSLADLGQLLIPEARVPEPLNTLESWLLLQVLKAVGALPVTPVTDEQEFTLTRDLIAQLQTITGQEHWEVFVAMHLPQSNLGDDSALVKDLLTRHASTLLTDPERIEFLSDMRVPGSWISRALAIWSKHTADAEGELNHWLDAEDWGQAHLVLTKQLAPQWFVVGKSKAKALRDALIRLAPHPTEVDESCGVNAFDHGAGLYLDFFSLQDALDQSPGDRVSLEQASKVVDLLNSVSDKNHVTPILAQVHSIMGLYLADWVATVEVDAVSISDCIAAVQRLTCLPSGAQAELSQPSALSLSSSI